MALRTQVTAPALPDTPARVLLRRRGQVILADEPVSGTAAEPGVALLEADLIDRGWLLSAGLRTALTRLDPADLVTVGSVLLADCDALLGADRPHVPLFRSFPASVPANTSAFFVDRVLVHLFQEPAQPCVLCGTEGLLAPVNPCGHLVCHACFDGADFAACPICHRRLDPADPFLQPAPERPTATARSATARSATAGSAPARLRVLHAVADPVVAAVAEVQALLARPAALPPGDAADLAVLLDLAPRDGLDWVPAAVPGRETKARLVGWLLAGSVTAPGIGVIEGLVDTATDVLRAMVVLSGGEPSLIRRPRFARIARPVRRLLLSLLARIEPGQLTEDLRRHTRSWVRAAERLHPGEFAHRYEGLALAFAALRRTDLEAHPAGAWLIDRATASPGIAVAGRHLTAQSVGRLVEQSIVDGQPDRAAGILARRRPGELIRRLDHLLRIASPAQADGVLDALATALPQVSAAVLLAATGAIRTRVRPDEGLRVFLPASTAAHVIAETRPALPAGLVARTVGLLEGELLRRAAALSPVDCAIVDAGTDGLVVPFAERTAARALVTLPRGSVLPMPPGRHLRLFLHWQEEPGNRVDLDLSVALFDPQWTHRGTCDYTHLRVGGDAAVHSGDLTSAPGPLGSSEFVDLDLATLAPLARYAVVVVFSFNNVPFVELPEAFAGWMMRADDPAAGEVFDARAVEQRFDLTGPDRASMVLVVDLVDRTLRWLDVAPRVTGTDHAVHRHHHQLATVASGLVAEFEAGSRVSIGELGRLLAAGRAGEVIVRDGSAEHHFRRRAGEDPAAFLARIRTGPPEPPAPSGTAPAALQVLVHGGAAPDGAEVYALHPGPLDAARIRLLGAADLPALLAPLPALLAP